jgi:hypothetical protein
VVGESRVDELLGERLAADGANDSAGGFQRFWHTLYPGDPRPRLDAQLPLVGVALTCEHAVNHVVGCEVFQSAKDGPLGVCQRDADRARVGRAILTGKVADEGSAQLRDRVEGTPGDDFPGFGPAEAEDAASTPELAELLDDPGGRLWVADELSLVFTNSRGKAVNRNIFNRDAWKPALAAAGVIPPRKPGNRNWPAAPDDGLHALRHTAASAWLSRGVDITAVASWLGDTVATVYTYYAHMMPDADDRGRAAMTAFFAELAGRDCARLVPQAR